MMLLPRRRLNIRGWRCKPALRWVRLVARQACAASEAAAASQPASDSDLGGLGSTARPRSQQRRGQPVKACAERPWEGGVRSHGGGHAQIQPETGTYATTYIFSQIRCRQNGLAAELQARRARWSPRGLTPSYLVSDSVRDTIMDIILNSGVSSRTSGGARRFVEEASRRSATAESGALPLLYAHCRMIVFIKSMQNSWIICIAAICLLTPRANSQSWRAAVSGVRRGGGRAAWRSRQYLCCAPASPPRYCSCSRLAAVPGVGGAERPRAQGGG